MRKDPKSKTEKAFVAYLTGNQPGTVLETCSVYAGGLFHVPSTLTPPWVIFSASEPEQIGYDSGIYEMKLKVCLATQIDDEMDEAGHDVHRERIEALRDLIEDVPTLQASINPPIGTDDRLVKDFTLSCLVYNNDDETKMNERKLTSDWSYYVCASPSDVGTHWVPPKLDLELAKALFIQNYSWVTGQTGGGHTNIDGIPTTGDHAARVNWRIEINDASSTQWRLAVGTGSDTNVPDSIVVPVDYDPSHPVVWVRTG